MNKNKELELEYSISGFCASFRLGTPFKDFEEGISRNLIPASQYLKDKLNDHVKMSGLFNAFTEETFANRVEESGHNFQDLFPDNMYADSGGLQVLTQGKMIDAAMKKKIYTTQAKYANYAMSFDEMPFKMVDGQKIYLPDRVSICGTMAGENLKEQIEFFDSIDSKTKIFPIIQGLGLKDMSTYTLNMLNVLDKQQLSKLECLAVGGIQSEFELLERSVNIYKIDGIPKKIKNHFHVLGVTGFRKLLPIMIGARNGLLPDIGRLSFDSTTFSKSYLLGNIQPTLSDIKKGSPKRSLGKVRDAFVEDYYQQMWDFWKDIPENVFYSVEDMIEHSCFNSKGLTTAAQQYKELGAEHGIKTITQKYVYVYYNTFKFLEILEGYLKNEIILSDFMGNYKQLSLLQALEDVKNTKDFEQWYSSVRKSTKVDKKSVDDGESTTDFLF
jgi:hypothetical protein